MLAIEVSDLWKQFRLRTQSAGLRDLFIQRGRLGTEDFWALRGVSLAIPKGITVGLIGRNGSGKSTLLKIIGRILYPTKGEVKVNGRVATLLELGAGFHPDFTGRENVFLNASILGLRRQETKERLSDIVSFAGIGDFLDSPVRNYSSGMYMRLGFAIAVHADPDILLIDEVLAVGDLSFQAKCIERIKELQRQGKTIVFVTHAPPQVRELCHMAVWLDAGQVREIGDASRVADRYVAEVAAR